MSRPISAVVLVLATVVSLAGGWGSAAMVSTNEPPAPQPQRLVIEVPAEQLAAMMARNQQLREENAELTDLIERAIKKIDELKNKGNCA